MRKITLAFLLAVCAIIKTQAQETFPRNGVYDERVGLVAFTNATIFVDYQTRLDKATLLIRNGKVEASGINVKIPAGATVINAQGKFIYPSFIDLFSTYGMPAVNPVNVTYTSPPQAESTRKGVFNWNQAIRPENNAAELFKVDAKAAEDYRNQGFGTVVTQHPDGIARGTAALVTVAPKRENQVMLRNKVAAGLSFNRGSSTQDYPNSLMGAIALIRQTYLDADLYRQHLNENQDLSLQAFYDNQKLPHIFETPDKLNELRADKIGDEYGQQYILKGSGDEYQMIREIKATNAPVIVPVNFPEAYNVEDPLDADRIAMEDLKHWEMAAANAATLSKNNIAFAFTAADLKDKKRFLANVRKALAYGLPEKEALRALTDTPARLMQVQNTVGALRPGMLANFIITNQPVFQSDNAILENWIQGERYPVRTLPTDMRGVYTLQVGQQTPVRLEITGQPEKPEARLIFKNPAEKDSSRIKTRVSLTNDLITLAYSPDAKNPENLVRLSGWFGSGKFNFQGSGQLPDGSPVKWSATLIKSLVKPVPLVTATQITPAAPVGSLVYPFTAFGRATLPKPETVLIKNATVWTNEKEGRLENANVLWRNGKIEKVGKNIAANGAKVIDGTNKHLTPGIIDEHSHIAISHSVNEGTQAVTAEVRIGDVVDPEDINIYRQLAGGVVASQLLHGSANPIGGQSALIKLRWGLGPEELKIKGADNYIKFALGENVKHSNRTPQHNVRFPQTRMGVEQVYIDVFQRAKEYDLNWKNFKKLSRSAQAKVGAPRRDLELEALAEILNKQRFITCHSYVQSEINMLLKVADQMGFQVNTFTHILEGYKVADKMKKHGSGASTFSDWWAYKMEVKDAIPYNAALMTNVGLVTAINSDDAEMARRLNQEAAKTVKYGGLSEEEALKLVTLNPAKLLHLDERMGSLKPGKDADLVLWTDHPLSIYAKAEKTFVDGTLYYDLETDQQLRQERDKERQRLIQKMLAAKQSGEPTQPIPVNQKGEVKHCEDVLIEESAIK